MKVDVFDLNGKAVEKVDLPKVFQNPIREDIIRRAVVVSTRNKRQSYGSDTMAGKRTAAHYHGKRRARYSMMNKEMARLPRLHNRTVPFLMMRARFVPQAVKGRRAHPPLVEKVWERKINQKEKRMAINSALAAVAIRDFVVRRGHQIQNIKEVPIIVEDKLQDLKKTKDLIEFLKKIGLDNEVERISERKVRAGKGKNRVRKYKTKVGPLFVVTKEDDISKAAENIIGCDVRNVNKISAEDLAPGAALGRLTIFTKSALTKL